MPAPRTLAPTSVGAPISETVFMRVIVKRGKLFRGRKHAAGCSGRKTVSYYGLPALKRIHQLVKVIGFAPELA